MEKPVELTIQWTDYMKYRAMIRKYNLEKVEKILRYSTERYFDSETRMSIVIGKHGKQLVMIPYEKSGHIITPVTVHAISRQQIKFRQNTGRFENE